MAHMRNTRDTEVQASVPAPLTGPHANSVGDDPADRQPSSGEPESFSDPAPPPQAKAGWRRWAGGTSGEHRPMVLALLLSLLFHVLLLSLTFGGDTLGLPGLVAPWRDRRVEEPDLRIVLVPAPVNAAEPARQPVVEPPRRASIDPSVAGQPATAPPVSPALSPPVTGVTAVTNAPAAAAWADAPQDAVTSVTRVETPAPPTGPDLAAQVQTPKPAGVGVALPEAPAAIVLATPLSPTSVIVVAPSASSPQTVPSASQVPGDAAQQAQREDAERQEAARQEAARSEAQREELARQEAARAEAARLDTERQNTARQTAARVEAQLEEAARQEAARAEATRLEAERQNSARQAASQLEAQRQGEAARVEAARLEAERREAALQESARQAAARLEAQREETARQEAARAESARLESERQEAARQETTRQAAARLEEQRREIARQDAARVQLEKDETAKREAVLRAIGRQLDEEAAQREAAKAAARLPNTLPYSLSTARRVRLWGRSDPNVELVQYAEAWARKIQFNTAVDTVRELAQRPHAPPLVTVAVRSDGSVESVTIVVTSGVAEVDEAIRRIVESHKPYPVFPPALARQFDVIEIRRTWSFDSAIRLQ